MFWIKTTQLTYMKPGPRNEGNIKVPKNAVLPVDFGAWPQKSCVHPGILKEDKGFCLYRTPTTSLVSYTI